MSDLARAVSDPDDVPTQVLVDSFSSMIRHPDFPCLGARSVFRQENATLRVYDELGADDVISRLLADLTAYAQVVDPDAGFASFIALFRGPQLQGEQHFEELLWKHLRALHAADPQPWNAGVSSDPSDPHFAFSVAGTAFFVVGLHPLASRDARRSPVPTLVFNLHQQFEDLRASGRFPRFRDAIRDRDTALQGSTNPMVDDHGGSSEARQYSGRHVPTDWSAPFEENA